MTSAMCKWSVDTASRQACYKQFINLASANNLTSTNRHALQPAPAPAPLCWALHSQALCQLDTSTAQQSLALHVGVQICIQIGH